MAQKLLVNPNLDEFVVVDKYLDPGTRLRMADEEVDFTGTIWDPELEDKPGLIQLAPDFLYLKDATKFREVTGWRPNWAIYPPERLRSQFVDLKGGREGDAFIKAGNAVFVRVPRGINRMFTVTSGVGVLSSLQRAANDLIRGMLLAQAMKRENPTGAARMANASLWRYFAALKDELLGLNGIWNKISGARVPYSGRGVAIGNPTLKFDEIGIPKKIIDSFIKHRRFRDFFEADDIRAIEGKLVIAGRQPTHDRSNLVAMRVKLVPGDAIHMNPAVANLFDGDFDGDMFWFAFVLDETVDLNQMKIDNVMDEMDPGKEFKRFNVDTMDFTKNPDEIITHVFEASTDGLSIDWTDIKGSYLGKVIKDDDMEETIKILNGDIKHTIVERANRAVVSYAMIKRNTAFLGSLGNNFTRILGSVYGRKGIQMGQKLYHVLAQKFGLDNKKCKNTEHDFARELSDHFTRSTRMGTRLAVTAEEVIDLVVNKMELPEIKEEITAMAELFFSEDPVIPIRELAEKLAPEWSMTRRTADEHLIPASIELIRDIPTDLVI